MVCDGVHGMSNVYHYATVCVCVCVTVRLQLCVHDVYKDFPAAIICECAQLLLSQFENVCVCVCAGRVSGSLCLYCSMHGHVHGRLNDHGLSG